MSYKRSGFTLIELSIVLMIIGLLVAGILTGKELIRQAELRSVVKDIEAYTIAYNTFKTKYDAYPGDMKNATTFWPSGGTVNGNGDGKIVWGPLGWWHEPVLAWQHLSLSNLIQGEYTGQAAAPTTFKQNVNVPESNISSGTFLYYNEPWGIFGTTYTNNFLLFGKEYGGSGYPNGSIFVPHEAKSIDEKYDDGIAFSGRMLGATGEGEAATTACSGKRSTANPSDYNINNNTLACYFYIHTMQF